jgi:mono/diheme cytochrome c family protein
MRLLGSALAALLIGPGAFAADVMLRPGPGAEATAAICSACHTPDYIVMNSVFLTAEAWEAEVAKMRTAFGAPIDEATAAEIAAYLATNYAARGKP